MKKKMANHFVVLHPEYRNMFDNVFEDHEVVAKGDVIYCHTLEENARYLEAEVLLASKTDNRQWVKMSIAHSAVLYTFSAPDLNQKQALGFYADASMPDTPPD